MSFDIKQGDLFANVTEGYILHGCNAQGVMGSGVARIVRDMYPEAYTRYMERHDFHCLQLGDIVPALVTPNLIILNGITQDLYGHDGGPYVMYPALRQVFEGSALIAENGALACTDLHMPLVGGGLGGGNPERIVEMMWEIFSKVNINTTLWLLEKE